MDSPRTLIIGIDGATFDLVEPWTRSGHLPTLARLMSEGAHGPLTAWPNMNSAAAWTSMVTGYNPGQHGIFDFGDIPPKRDHKWRPTSGADRRKDPFWCHLSAAGQQVGVVNVPISYPADPINGFMLSGMDTPGVRSPGFAHPSVELREALREAGIDYVLDVPDLGTLSKRDPDKALQLVRHMVETRSRTVLHLMETRPWDALMAVFIATDRMQHHFWADEDPLSEGEAWLPIRSLYQQIDSFLEQALERAGSNTTVLIVSDHGFGPSCLGRRSLNEIFSQLGLLRFQRGGSSWTTRALGSLLKLGRKVIPQSQQRRLATALPRLRLRAVGASKFPDIDWAGTQVLATVFGTKVYVNLEGREVAGIVTAEDYGPLREQVRDILLALTDPVTGDRVVRSAKLREEVFSGPCVDRAADLVVDWDFDVVGESLCYSTGDAHIVVQAEGESHPGARWIGEHRPEGIFIACGPNIKKGASVTGARLYDVTPTILYAQNHPVPSDMDGEVLTQIFSEERLRAQPVEWKEPSDPTTREVAPLNSDDASAIEERLRALGYLR